MRKGTNSKHLYKAEIEWDLLFRPQSSGGSYSESEAYAVLEELAAILATFRPQVLIPVKRTKKSLNLHHLTPLEVVELILAQDRPLVRRMKVPQNLHHLPPLGVVGLVVPIELKKIYIIQKKKKNTAGAFRNRANMQRRKFTSLDCSRNDDRLSPGSLTARGLGEG